MSLKEFQIYSDQWMKIRKLSGSEEIGNEFTRTINGKVLPKFGLICSI
jgi:hypothetical protein